jgi:hypothetical protein
MRGCVVVALAIEAVGLEEERRRRARRAAATERRARALRIVREAVRERARREAVVSIFRPEGMPGVLPFVRKDSLPEEARYTDAGCELSRTCLRCPLPKCQYDDPDSVRGWLIAARDREIALLHRRYRAPVEALADTYGISRRSVFRIVSDGVVKAERRRLPLGLVASS